MSKNTGRQKILFFSLPVKVQGDSYSLDIAESEYCNQIAPSPTNFKGGGIILKKNGFNRKVICLSLITIYNVNEHCLCMVS
jgi:hypothetical protein